MTEQADVTSARANAAWADEVRTLLLQTGSERPGDRILAWSIDPQAHEQYLQNEDVALDEALVRRVRFAAHLANAVLFNWPAGSDTAPNVDGERPDAAVVVERVRQYQATANDRGDDLP